MFFNLDLVGGYKPMFFLNFDLVGGNRPAASSLD